NENVRASWALVEVAPLMATVQVADADLEAYLKGHEAEYRQPEQRKTSYVTISIRDFIKAPGDAEVEKYYTEHAAEFQKRAQPGGKTPLKEVATQIRDRLSAADADRAAKAKADEVRGKLAGASDFSAEARKLGLTPIDVTIPKTEATAGPAQDTMAQAVFELA